DHAEERALADTGSREDADALAAPAGEERVDRADAELERRADRLALERVDGAALQRDLTLDLERPGAVDRLPEPVEHAPEEAAPRPPDRPDADVLGDDRFAAVPALDRAHAADRDARAVALDHEADHVGHAPAPADRVGVLERPVPGREVDPGHAGSSSSLLSVAICESIASSTSPIDVSTTQASGANDGSSTISSSFTSSRRARSSAERDARNAWSSEPARTRMRSRSSDL